MHYREARFTPCDTDALLGEYASIDDVSELIDEDTVLTVDGVPVVAYYRDIEGMDVEPLRVALGKVQYTHAKRATGKKAMKPYSKIFGYQPRIPFRNKPCRIAGLALDAPDIHQLLEGWTGTIADLYTQIAPVAAEAHQAKTTEKIKEEFHLAGSMFTSGIVNKTSQLPYHFDAGNFKGAWSAMLGIKRWIEGGYLVVPEYDVALEIADGSMTFFDGQARLHGVTPIKKLNEDGERYTIVWYSLEKMWMCLTAAEEVVEFNKRATQHARTRAIRGNRRMEP
jgi:hypothetical protein